MKSLMLKIAAFVASFIYTVFVAVVSAWMATSDSSIPNLLLAIGIVGLTLVFVKGME